MCSSDVYVGHDIHARPKLVILIFSRFEDNFDRNALDDFYIIAGGIFRRKQAEERPGGAGNAVHVSLESPAARIDVNIGFLPDFHVPQFRLFEIGGDPDIVQWDHGEQLLPWLNVQANDNRFGHFAADRSDNLGVLQIQLRLLESGASLLNISDRGASAGLGGGNLLRAGLGGTLVRFGLPQTAVRLLNGLFRCRLVIARGRHSRCAGSRRGEGLIVHLRGYFLFVDEGLVTNKIILRLHVIRFGNFQLSARGAELLLGRNDSRARVFHSGRGEFQLAFGIHGRDWNGDVQGLGGCFGAREIRFSLLDRDLII